MIIETYIIKKKVNNLDDIEKDYNLYFERIVSREQLIYINDFSYIEGAIIIKENDEYLIGFDKWDIIDFLYVMFIDSLYELIVEKKEYSEFFFPDQPIKVAIRIINNQFIIFIDDKKSVFEKKVFVRYMIDEVEFILGLFATQTGDSYYGDTFRKIMEIKKVYFN